MNPISLCLALLWPLAFASDNGLYYECDTAELASNNQCIFKLNGGQPTEWVDETIHDVGPDPNSAGPDFYRGVESYTGDMLSVSPKPWVNGDKLACSSDPVTGDKWNGFAHIFELMAPLRDMMMYDPGALDADTWAKYTRALTDCNQKTVNYDREGGTPYSTSQVYEYVKDPQGKDIHHPVLQYMEEGSIDLVCISSELDMTHCDGSRSNAGSSKGDRCNCWFDAYKAIYGRCPVVDQTFTHCPNTIASVDCANEVPVDTSSLVTMECTSSDDTEMPSPPEMPEKPSPPAKG